MIPRTQAPPPSRSDSLHLLIALAPGLGGILRALALVRLERWNKSVIVVVVVELRVRQRGHAEVVCVCHGWGRHRRLSPVLYRCVGPSSRWRGGSRATLLVRVVMVTAEGVLASRLDETWGHQRLENDVRVRRVRHRMRLGLHLGLVITLGGTWDMIAVLRSPCLLCTLVL